MKKPKNYFENIDLLNKIYKLKWKKYKYNPIIKPPFLSPIIADPTFLPPENTPDKKWHLFAHSIFGIHHFISNNGIKWQRLKNIVVKKSLRPFLYFEKNKYYLFYEKILSLFPMRTRIEVRFSKDLYKWSGSKTVLVAALNWHKRTCGNPCLIKDNNEYKLYYSAALSFLKDCGFSEPTYIGIAVSKKISGPFLLYENPIIFPDKNDIHRNLSAGSIKVLKVKNGYIGFQNGIAIDKQNHSRSAIKILTSNDGYKWKGFNTQPILAPTNFGWEKALVYACDVRIINNKILIYYNARNGWLIGKECIGVCEGN